MKNKPTTLLRGLAATAASVALLSCSTTSTFDATDTNDDGRISTEEVENLLIVSIFRANDTNGDGKVTLEEWKAANPDDDVALFQARDLNKDGVVTLRTLRPEDAGLARCSGDRLAGGGIDPTGDRGFDDVEIRHRDGNGVGNLHDIHGAFPALDREANRVVHRGFAVPRAAHADRATRGGGVLQGIDCELIVDVVEPVGVRVGRRVRQIDLEAGVALEHPVSSRAFSARSSLNCHGAIFSAKRRKRWWAVASA